MIFEVTCTKPCDDCGSRTIFEQPAAEVPAAQSAVKLTSLSAVKVILPEFAIAL